MIKGIIFDLDQTIVDSLIAESLRRQRQWSKVYEMIPAFEMYEGFNEVFSAIVDDIKIGIVTSSPGSYAKRVITHFNIPHDFIVDYHSVTRRKPNPEPMTKALELFDLSSNEVVSFGDRAMDIISSNSAGIKSVACTWGSQETEKLISATPTKIIHSPREIIKALNTLKDVN